MKPEIKIVNFHHEVLAAWAALRRTLDIAPAVWSLDYHTDTMPCFRGALPPPGSGIWQDENEVSAAIGQLQHDEHFDWALRSGLVSKINIGICGENCGICAHPAMKVFRPDDFPDTDVILNHPEKFRPAAEQMLETAFLSRLFPELPAPGETYILDIDCDYILCRQALFPQDDKLLKNLLKNAALVTLSRENDWVKILKLPGETITGEEIAEIIAQRLADN